MQRITPEEHQRLIEIAQGVQKTLHSAALPAHIVDGNYETISERELGGASIYIDTHDDLSGVLVKWNGEPRTFEYARAEFMADIPFNSTEVLAFIAQVSEVMLQALMSIIQANGHIVSRIDTSGYDSLYVTS